MTIQLSEYFIKIVILFLSRMAPEVIACDENTDATYDNRVRLSKNYYLWGFVERYCYDGIINFF